MGTNIPKDYGPPIEIPSLFLLSLIKVYQSKILLAVNGPPWFECVHYYYPFLRKYSKLPFRFCKKEKRSRPISTNRLNDLEETLIYDYKPQLPLRVYEQLGNLIDYTLRIHGAKISHNFLSSKCQWCNIPLENIYYNVRKTPIMSNHYYRECDDYATCHARRTKLQN